MSHRIELVRGKDGLPIEVKIDEKKLIGIKKICVKEKQPFRAAFVVILQ